MTGDTMHFATHIAAALLGLATFILTLPGLAQAPGVGQGPKLGELEIKAYQKIPKTKVAVQLTSDNHLARELRRQVMIRLSQRGNEVGFSGGNVMRMDVSFYDLLGGNDRDTGTIGGQPFSAPPGSNPRMDRPANPIGRRDGLTPSTAGPTLRITLTLYAVDTGKVLWTATGSCSTQAGKAQQAGEAIINRMFDNADRNMAGDAGCPL
jgi:hypothetical protein